MRCGGLMALPEQPQPAMIAAQSTYRDEQE